MTPEMVHALATATRQWHQATRHFELCSRSFSDAQTQLQHAERDLHELARAIEVVTAMPASELVTSAPIGAAGFVTMPVMPTSSAIGAPVDGFDAGAAVLEHMMQQRMGMP